MAKNETPLLIQPIEIIRIFAQSLLKTAPSRARFAMLGCYIRKDLEDMKRFVLVLAVVTFALTVAADEYTDPLTNVVYTYDPNGTTAEVKKGVRHDLDGSTVYKAGSPNASGSVVILEKVIVNGKEFSVTKIGDFAFSMLNELIHVSIPSSISSIGFEAFAGCSKLESIDIKEGLQEICQESFRGCVSLKSVLLPLGLESIGFGAFSGCQELTSIIIPASVSDIHVTSFYSCNSLGSIIVEEGNSVYDSRCNCNAIVKTADNMLLIGCMNTDIPESITSIGEKAFMSCQGLSVIGVPESVREIGNYAFENCTNLRELTLSEGLQAIRWGAFWNCGLTTVIVPASVREIEPGAFWMSKLATLTSLIEEPFEVNKICNLDACQTALYVPVGSIEKYRVTPDWSQFPEIQEIGTNKVGAVSFVSDNYSDTLIDLQAHRLSGQPQKGIYIQNGKKILK